MCICVCMLSHVQLFTTPWTEACTSLLCPCDSPGKNAGVCFHFLQGIFLSQGLNLYLLPVLPALADGVLFFITWANWEASLKIGIEQNGEEKLNSLSAWLLNWNTHFILPLELLVLRPSNLDWNLHHCLWFLGLQTHCLSWISGLQIGEHQTFSLHNHVS